MAIEIIEYTFDDPDEFIFDSSIIEVTGGKAKLKDLRPSPNATFFANYDVDENANWGNGVLTGTLVNGATVFGGKLDLKGGITAKRVDYSASLNVDSQQVGAIRFIIIPNYSGNPIASRSFFVLSEFLPGGIKNAIQLLQRPDGNIKIFIFDKDGSAIMSEISFGVWNPTSGTPVEFELNWDIDVSGTGTRLFLDGIQQGSTQTQTGVRDTNITAFTIGTDSTLAIKPDFEIDQFLVFDQVQHTANYTPGQSISPTIYDITKPTIKPKNTLNARGLIQLNQSIVVVGSDTVQYTIEDDTVENWFDSLEWSLSSGFSQSNLQAIINTNASTLNLNDGSLSRPVIFLNSDNGLTTPEILNLQFEIDKVFAFIIEFNFDDPNNFTFDDSLIEIVAGKAQLKDISSSTANFFANYDIDENATFSDGDGTGTLVNGATVANGKLNLKGGVSGRHVSYAALDNADSQQTGAIRVTFIPNYTGFPNSTQDIITIRSAKSVLKNRISVAHTTSGTIGIVFYDKDGILLILALLGSFSAVSGTAVEIELNYDITTGATRLFLGGVQQGATQVQTGVRDTSINDFMLGTDFTEIGSPDFEIDQVSVFDQVQHVSDYTPGSKFSTAFPTIKPKVSIQSDLLLDFVSIVTETGSDKVLNTLLVGVLNKFWDGFVWNISENNTQLNSAPVIKNNLVDLNLGSGAFATPIIYLKSSDGTTTPSIDKLTMEFNFNPPDISDTVPKVRVFGYVFKSDGMPDANATVTAVAEKIGEFDNVQIPIQEISITTDIDGSWFLELIPSDEIGSIKYNFVFLNFDDKKEKFRKSVIDKDGTGEVKFEDLR